MVVHTFKFLSDKDKRKGYLAFLKECLSKLDTLLLTLIPKGI